MRPRVLFVVQGLIRWSISCSAKPKGAKEPVPGLLSLFLESSGPFRACISEGPGVFGMQIRKLEVVRMTSRGRDLVAETCTPASALYVIESAADGTRLHAAHTMGQPEPLSASSWGGYGPGTLKLTGP